MKFFTSNRTIIGAGLAIGILSFALTFYWQQPKKILSSSTVVNEEGKVFSTSELAKYDGNDPSLPIYLGLDGNVYDVTPGKKFYATGGAYHSLAGRDSSAMLHIAGGEIIKKKYKVVGKLTGN